MHDLAVLILAAGASSRMGVAKQTIRIAGRSLLEHAMFEARSVSANVVVVLGCGAGTLEPIVRDAGGSAVVNPNWAAGMGESIVVGMRAIDTLPHIRACLVAVCDQPEVGASEFAELIETWRRTGAAIVAARYAQSLGVPAVFDRRMFVSLLGLSPDSGAKRLIAETPGVIGVEMARAATDLDTPADVERYKAR